MSATWIKKTRMIINLTKSIYPPEFVPLAEKEFSGELKIEVINTTNFDYEVEVICSVPTQDEGALIGRFLNRL